MNVTEKTVENYLVTKWKEATGGEAVKFPPLFYAGFPDRICLAAPGLIVFVETKAPGKTPRKLQIKIIDKLKAWGFRVEVLDTKDAVDGFILTL